jgi:hypothetical protein
MSILKAELDEVALTQILLIGALTGPKPAALRAIAAQLIDDPKALKGFLEEAEQKILGTTSKTPKYLRQRVARFRTPPNLLADAAQKSHKPPSVKSRPAAKVFNSSHAAQAAGTTSNRALARFPHARHIKKKRG